MGSLDTYDAYPNGLAAKVDRELFTTGRPGARPAGLTGGHYNNPAGPLLTPQPAACEREWATSHLPNPPKPMPNSARIDPNSSDAQRYWGSVPSAHKSTSDPTAGRKVSGFA